MVNNYVTKSALTRVNKSDMRQIAVSKKLEIGKSGAGTIVSDNEIRTNKLFISIDGTPEAPKEDIRTLIDSKIANSLLNYVTKASLDKTLKNYVTNTSLNEALAATLEDALEDYVTNTSLNEALAATLEDYVTKASLEDTLNEALEDYVTNDTLETTDIITALNIGGQTTSGNTAVTIKDGRSNPLDDDIWDNTVSMSENNTITIHGGDIDASLWGLKNGYNTKGAVTVDEVEYTTGENYLTKVDDDAIYNGETKIANYKSSEVKNGSHLFHNTTLSSYDGNLDSLTNGEWMFANTDLVNWQNNMEELENAESMFQGCILLETYTGDSSSLINSKNMFNGCSKLNTFIGDMSSLKNAEQMFYNCTALTAVIGDFSNVENVTGMFRGCTSIESVDIELPVLTDYERMFQSCSSLKNVSIDVSNVENGKYMFRQSGIQTMDSDFPNLINGNNMFYKSALESFNGDLSRLESAIYMFCDCSNLKTFNSPDLSSLTNSYGMFRETGLVSFKANLKNLTNEFENGGYSNLMFENCRSLESFEAEDDDLNSLLKGRRMFCNCSSLKSIKVNMNSLTNGHEMFNGCSSLTSFEGDLSALTDLNNMFNGCTSLTNFTADLSSLPDGQCQNLLNMFKGDAFTKIQYISGDMSNLRIGNHCMKNKTSLETFNVNLPSLYDASEMFLGCTNLTTFNSESGLPALVSGHNMFNGCTSLTSFSGDMTIMTNGTDMFKGCKLDKDSVLGIINCLKTTNTCANAANLTLGINASLRNDSDILTALGISEGASSASLTGHGGGTWTITIQWNS